MNHIDYHSGPRWFPFKNAAGEEIPAWGVVRISYSELLFQEIIFEAAKPNAYGSQYSHFINSHTPVPSGGYGMCACAAGVPVVALWDSADGVVSVGQRVGPRSGSFKLRKDTGGFRVVHNTTIESGGIYRVLVVQQPMLHFIGKTDAAHAKAATGTISIWAGGVSIGSEADTTVNMTGVYNRFANLEITKWVRCEWNEIDDWWDLVSAEC